MNNSFEYKVTALSVSVIILSSFMFLKADEQLIESIRVTQKRVDIQLNKNFKEKYLISDFFVEYEDDEIDLTKLDLSIVMMPLYMNLITLIWVSGDRYYIESMDNNLYFSLEKVKEVFKRLYPKTKWDGELIPRRLVDNTNKFLTKKKSNSEIALLFSHGLDSLTTSFQHLDKKQLLITAWGHFDSPLEQAGLWTKLKNMVINYANKFNCKNTFLRSNYHDFIDLKFLDKNITPEITCWRIEAVEGLGWIGLVSPILLSKGYTKFYIASSYHWDNPYPQAALPLIDHNIKFAGIDVIHDGFESTRAKKNKYLVGECKKRNIDNIFVRVCQNNPVNNLKNCCRCEKCLRTIVGFLILGEDLHKFGFHITREKAIKNLNVMFKRLKARRKLVDRISYYWKEFQSMALENLVDSDGQYKEFLEWLIEQDINAMTKFRPIDHINWKNFVDLYDAIPENLLR